jgi:hypothetical protein
MSLTLIVGFPQSENTQRKAEYDLCLLRNISNKNFDQIVILEEEKGARRVGDWTGDQRVLVEHIGRRCNYSDYIRVSNQHKGVVVVANSDVYFDWSAVKLKFISERTVFAITRTDMLAHKNLYSTDAWAFRPPLDLTGCDWHIGRWDCENAFLEQVVRQLEWDILNPCYEVRLTHVHGSQSYSSDHDDAVKCGPFVKPKTTSFDPVTTSFRYAKRM